MKSKYGGLSFALSSIIGRHRSLMFSLGLFGLILTGCGGANTDPGKTVTIRNDSIRNRRDAGEDLAAIREAEERAAQKAREQQFKSNDFNGNSTGTKSNSPKASNGSSTTSGGYRWGGASSTADKLGDLATLGAMAALFKGGTWFLGKKDKDKKDKDKKKPASKPDSKESAASAEAEAPEVSSTVKIITEDDTSSATPEELCFFGSEDRYKQVLDIFNAASKKEGQLL